jgi:hypothetical protein
MPNIEPEILPPEQENPLIPITPTALEAQERASIDAMVETSNRHPRPEIQVVRQRILSMATIDEETAESCIYTLRFWNNAEQKHDIVQGRSIRLAEIVRLCWKNTSAGARTIANDGRSVTAQGFCHDMENNVKDLGEASRSILDRHGRPYPEHLQLQIAAACCAIAKRNAIFAVIPFAIVKPVYTKILEVATGGAIPLITKVDKYFKRLYSMGVTKERILAVLGKEHMESVDEEDLGILVGLGTAIKEKEMTIEQAFAVTPEEQAKAGPVPAPTEQKSMRTKARERREQRERERAAQTTSEESF